MATEALTVQYLEDHRSLVHSYDSFGRAIAEIMVREARRRVIAEETDSGPTSVEFKADVTIASTGSTGCLGIEVCVPSIGCSKVHVSPENL